MRLKTLCVCIFLVIIVLIKIDALAQTGGKSTYTFLGMAKPARIAALGSNIATIRDNDLSLTVSNPSLITASMRNNLSLSYNQVIAGTRFGFASYGLDIAKLGSFVPSIQYISYGKFDNMSETGENLGQFNAGEYAFNLGWGRVLDTVFSIGANAKFIYSSLETYKSSGVAVDVGASYFPHENFCASVVFRNIGHQFKTYASSGNEPLPFEIDAGISEKLAHVPFRYSLVFQHLEKWDLSYADPDAAIDPFTGEAVKQSGFDAFGKNALRHLVVGGEFIPAKFLAFRVGYSYLRREEMKIDARPGMVGFSWGLGIRVSKFTFSYARAAYHMAGTPNYITIGTNFGDWGK